MFRAWKWTGLWIALACSLATESAFAVCTEGAVVDGRTPVDCDGESQNGYEPSVLDTDDIDLTLAADTDSVDESLSGDQAILLNANSTITNAGDITATVATHDAIVIGDNATITNSGTITGGSDATASAIVFVGTDPDAINTVENMDGGVISTDMGDAIFGSAGSDRITLQDGSLVTGDITLNDGRDLVSIQAGADLEGNVDLGAGDDLLILDTDETFDIDAGTGNDAITIRENVTFTTSTIFLGEDDDTLTMEAGVEVIGNVNAGDGNDRVILETMDVDGVFVGATLTGDVDLGSSGDGDDAQNFLGIRAGSMVDGNVNGGADVDRVKLSPLASITGDVMLADGDDILILQATSAIDGVIDLGPGEDLLDIDFSVTFDNSIILGGGNDRVLLRPGAVLPTTFTEDLAGDTVQLGPTTLGGPALGEIDLSTLDAFGELLIGADDSSSQIAWQISTSSPANFENGVTLQTQTVLTLDGTVEIEVDSGAAFTQEADSVMYFDIGEAIDDSRLEITGALVLEDDPTPTDPDGDDESGATLVVRFVGKIVEGEYTLITATSHTGNFDVENFPPNPLFEFKSGFSSDMGVDLYKLFVERIGGYVDIPRLLQGVPYYSSQESVAQYLDDAQDDAEGTSFEDVIDLINSMLEQKEEAGLATAFAQLHAENYDAHTSNVLSWGRLQQRELQQRNMRCERFQYAPRPEIVTDSPCGSKPFMPWVKVIGNFGQNDRSSDRGYDSFAGGVLFGIDHKWNESLWLSGTLGVGGVEIEHDIGDDSQFTSIDLGVAAGTLRGPLSIRGSLSYSHGFHNITRKVDFVGAKLKGDFQSDRLSLGLGAGYRLKLGPIMLEPNTTIDYTHITEQSVKESGHAEVALKLKARETDVFSGTAGLRFSTNILKYRYVGDMLEWADGLWTPVVSLQWRHIAGNVDRGSSAKMRGLSSAAGSFKSTAHDSSGGAEIGAHLSFQPLRTATTIEIGYDVFFGDHVTNHSATATVRIPF